MDYSGFLDRLGIKAPHKWIVGMEDLKGRHLYRPTKVRVRPSHDGVGLIPEVTESGLYSPGDPVGPALKPFFVKLYQSCGLSRQQWQDE
jgi:hypothetical protein